MPAGSIVCELLLKTGTFETDTKRAAANLRKMEQEAAAVGKSMGLAFVGAAAAAAAFVKSQINALDTLVDISDATGVTVENLSALERIANLNGQSLDDVSSILIKFNQALKGSDENSGAVRALKAIGLDAAELQRLDPAEALRRTAVALAGFADDGNKARIVQELFGKSIREAGPYLKDLAENGKLVATVTTEQAKEAEKFNKELFLLQTNAKDAGRALAIDFVSGTNTFIESLRKGEVNVVSFHKKLLSLATDYLSFGLLKSPFDFKITEGINHGSGPRGARDPVDPKPSVGPLPDAEKKVKKLADEYGPLIKRIREMAAASQAALNSEEPLTRAQELGAKVAQDYADGTLKISKAQYASVKAELANADVLERTVDARRRETDATLAAIRAREAYLQQTLQAGEAFSAEAVAAREALQAFGLSTGEVEKLAIAKLRAAAAAREHDAILLEERDHLDPVAQAFRAAAASIRETAAAREELLGKQDFLSTDSMAGATQAVKDYLGEIKNAGDSTRDAVGDAFKGFEDLAVQAFMGKNVKDAAKKLVDQLIAQFFRLKVIQPLMGAILDGKGWESLARIFGGGGGGSGGYEGFTFGAQPAYASGTNMVPNDGPAFLHKGEAVVPARYNPAAGATPKVEIHNHTGTAATAKAEQMDDGTLSVIMDRVEDRITGSIAKGGGVHRAMADTYGLNRGRGLPKRG